MRALHEVQAGMAAAIRFGPDRIPAALFAGPAERVLLGFKVHANTISHGRLIALEDSFPLTRTAMGELWFNRLSRRFVEAGFAASASLAMIGAEFADWLAASRVARWRVVLARFEWAWLCAYRAADAQPLRLTDLAGLDEAALLVLPVTRHPAARLVQSHARLPRNLGLPKGGWLLVTRPDAEVRVTGGGAELASLFAETRHPITIAALLDRLHQAHPRAALLAPIILAISAGALVRSEITPC